MNIDESYIIMFVQCDLVKPWVPCIRLTADTSKIILNSKEPLISPIWHSEVSKKTSPDSPPNK